VLASVPLGEELLIKRRHAPQESAPE
jgi:hypothetical protein